MAGPAVRYLELSGADHYAVVDASTPAWAQIYGAASAAMQSGGTHPAC